MLRTVLNTDTFNDFGKDGNPFGAADVNAVVRPNQAQLVVGIDMSSLSTLKI